MHLKIPSDDAIGQQLRVIAQAIAVIAVVFYIAGYTLGSAVHQLNASLTRLPAALPTITPVLNDSTHPAVPAAHGNDRPSAVRPRKPRTQPSRSGVGFA